MGKNYLETRWARFDAYKDRKVDAQVEAVDLKSVDRYLVDACAYITITKVTKEYNVPVINGIAFLTGVGQDKEFEKLVEAINKAK